MQAVVGKTRRLAGLTAPGREVSVRPADRFLVSYPRSGNTWMRFLVANALEPEGSVDFATVGRAIPDVYVDTRRTLDRAPRPRLIKSHEPFDARYGRTIYLVRHPADVAVSYYHFLVKLRQLREGFDLDRYLDAFLSGTIDDLGSWGDHVRGWLDARGTDDDFLLVRYEDVAAAPAVALRTVLAHLGSDVGGERIAYAVARSSADEMRRSEQQSVEGHRVMRHSRLEKPFVRNAAVGASARELPPAAAERIAGAWPDVLERVGYGPLPEQAANRGLTGRG